MNKLKSIINLHPEYAAFSHLPEHIQYQLKLGVTHWNFFCMQKSVEDKYLAGWTHEEKDLIARSLAECPVCSDSGYYLQVEDATGNLDDKKVPLVREIKVTCKCQIWKHTWNLAKGRIPESYHSANLWTLKPNSMSRLPKPIQQIEFEYIRHHPDDSYLFSGPAGTGKTTMSNAILRHSFERKENQKHTWSSERSIGFEFKDSFWIWNKDFNSIYQSYNAKQKEQFGEGVDSPYVTSKDIYAAKESGYRPVLLIEEVDKLALNPNRVNFLFSLLDAMINTNGQMIITTNASPSKFSKMLLAESENGETLLRRFFSKVRVRNHHEYLNTQ